jgi:hypothetical protein
MIAGLPPPDFSGSNPAAVAVRRAVSVANKLRLVRTNLLSSLQAASSTKEMSRLTIAFLAKHLPFAFGAVLRVSTGRSVEILAGPKTAPIADLRLHTPETPAGYALTRDELVYLPDLNSEATIVVHANAKKAGPREKLQRISQTTIRGLIPTLEDNALPNLRRNHWQTVLFVPLTIAGPQKELLVLGFNEGNPAPNELRIVPLLALGISAVFQDISA